MLDLSKSEQELRKDMDEDCRSEINKAERNAITFCPDSDNIREYHYIHKVSWNRTFGSHLPLKHFEDMVSYLEKDKVKLFFAQYKERNVSAILLHIYKDSAFYWGACSLEEGLKVRVNNYLLWSTILWAKSKGYKWFEIGLFQPYPGSNYKEYSVGQYKAQFSNNYYPALEGKKNYTRKALRCEYQIRDKYFYKEG
jgi:lipid II:glycine glycyltransferase (peptidoglycan interpeptide bridge formation enzyme)